MKHARLVKKLFGFFIILALSLTMTSCEKLFPPSSYTCQNLPEQFKNIKEIQALTLVLWRKDNPSLAVLENELLLFLQHFSGVPTKLWLRDDSIDNFSLSDHALEDGSVISAVISIETDDETSIAIIKDFLKAKGYSVGIYQVNKSIPLAYQKTWPNRKQSPALVSMSFFQKNENLSQEAFKDYWFCSHTPFAVDIHPLWHYERNAVVEVRGKNTKVFDGIVPLYVKQDADLNFSTFFSANNGNAVWNALRIHSDVKQFIDLSTIETVAMREYVLR